MLSLALGAFVWIPEQVEAASKTQYISVEKGKTATVKGIKKVPGKISGGTVTCSVKNGNLKIKGKKEGVSSFTISGKKYNVVVVPANVPGEHEAPEFISYKSGVYCVVRRFGRMDKFVTVYNAGSQAVDITFTHSDYRDKNTLFESRDYTVRALAPKESYTFFVYSCMPYEKESMKISNTSADAVKTGNVKASVLSHDSQYTKISYENSTDADIYAKICYAQLDAQGNIFSCGETDAIMVSAGGQSTQVIRNMGMDPEKVKIMAVHAYSTEE